MHRNHRRLFIGLLAFACVASAVQAIAQPLSTLHLKLRVGQPIVVDWQGQGSGEVWWVANHGSVKFTPQGTRAELVAWLPDRYYGRAGDGQQWQDMVLMVGE